MGYLGKIIAAKGFIKLPKVQKIAQSCHTACSQSLLIFGPQHKHHFAFLLGLKLISIRTGALV